MSYYISTFYKFVRLPDYQDLREPLLYTCCSYRIKGTILLASEGINATIAGTQQDVTAVLAYLRADRRLADLETKDSQAQKMPFDRMRVRLKQEIVSFGEDTDPSQQVGTYIDPQSWNALLLDPEVMVIDTRNTYEVEVGTFKGAVDPQTASFRDFPDYVRNHLDTTKHKKIAMFCTGGIRCEKATSYLLQKGFEEVYHLKGGILKYLEEIDPQDSLWEGECFVFDQRVTVQHGVEEGHYHLCFGCGNPISVEEMKSDQYEAGVSCPHCFESLTSDKQSRLRAKQRGRKVQAQST